MKFIQVDNEGFELGVTYRMDSVEELVQLHCDTYVFGEQITYDTDEYSVRIHTNYGTLIFRIEEV